MEEERIKKLGIEKGDLISLTIALGERYPRDFEYLAGYFAGTEWNTHGPVVDSKYTQRCLNLARKMTTKEFRDVPVSLERARQYNLEDIAEIKLVEKYHLGKEIDFHITYAKDFIKDE